MPSVVRWTLLLFDSDAHLVKRVQFSFLTDNPTSIPHLPLIRASSLYGGLAMHFDKTADTKCFEWFVFFANTKKTPLFLVACCA